MRKKLLSLHLKSNSYDVLKMLSCGCISYSTSLRPKFIHTSHGHNHFEGELALHIHLHREFDRLCNNVDARLDQEAEHLRFALDLMCHHSFEPKINRSRGLDVERELQLLL